MTKFDEAKNKLNAYLPRTFGEFSYNEFSLALNLVKFLPFGKSEVLREAQSEVLGKE